LYLVGSFNIQGFSALKRDMADDILATWLNIFKEADIVCVQETANIAGFSKLQDGLNATKLLFEPRCMHVSYINGFKSTWTDTLD
jgi:exonuclease III